MGPSNFDSALSEESVEPSISVEVCKERASVVVPSSGTRRQFLKLTLAAGAALAVSAEVALALDAQNRKTAIEAAHGSGARRDSVLRREETVLRYGVIGDNWHMSWGADDRQYVSQCDGFGLTGMPKGLNNSRMIALSGGPLEAGFSELSGYPEFMPALDMPRYYAFGTLALEGRLYQFLSTWNRPLKYGDPESNAVRFIGAKLIYSPDGGRTWFNHDGSTPIVWESWKSRSRQNLVFFEEEQEAFSLLSVLQMGRNYEDNRDGYVYVYSPNGNTDGTMNELVMFRVSKERILNRSAYEYFAGVQRNGKPKWSRDMNWRKPVHVFPRGWVNRILHPFAWHPSVVYNAPLDVYMMVNWGTAVAPSGDWFGKPSYLGFWVAKYPWGPWTQIHEETAWTPGGDAGARAFAPQIAPKWIAPDGKSLWLVWSDYQVKGQEEFDRYFTQELKRKYFKMEMSADQWAQFVQNTRKHRPFYTFNTQRVDLEFGRYTSQR